MHAHAPATAFSSRTPRKRSAWLATLCGLLIPGGGQLYVGRPGKAVLMLLAIGALYVGGLHLTGYTAVNPTTHKLEFIAHAMAIGPTALVTYLTQHVQLDRALPWLEIGRLYVAVAGLLNLVAISDAWGHVLHGNARADRLTRLLAHRRDRLAVAQRVPGTGGQGVLFVGSEPSESLPLAPEPAFDPPTAYDLASPPPPTDDDDGWDFFAHEPDDLRREDDHGTD